MRRPRVVLDTNVLISAILFGGPPRKVLAMVVAGRIDGLLSVPILDELKGVLQRRKSGFSPAQALRVVEELHGLCTLVDPTSTIDEITSDEADNRVLECTVEGRADFVVSGDRDLLRLGVYRGIQILSPRDALKPLREELD